jgi:Xaa-Pro aminopeptidase
VIGGKLPPEARLARVRERMDAEGVDVLIAGPSSDFRYLTGLEPPIPTRLTLFVLPVEGEPALVMPAFEAPAEPPCALHVWSDGDDPVAAVADVIGRPRRMAVSDRTWARYVIPIQAATGAELTVGSTLLDPVRAVKEPEEQAALRRAGSAVDRVLRSLHDLEWMGRSELDVARDLHELMLSCGHDEVHDVIVAAGPNGARPHHVPGPDEIRRGDAVVLDIGGSVDGYVSDVTRMVLVGEPPRGFEAVQEAVEEAHQAGRRAAAAGARAGDVDAAARTVLADAGLGEAFTHRLGHGVGLDTHESPYLAPGSAVVLEPGMAFTVEPGAYLGGRFGVRIEDAYVLQETGASALTHTAHAPIVVTR